MPLGKLHRIDDPRDSLSKARRPELLRFAQAHGLAVNEAMPADDYKDEHGHVRPGIRTMLREKGLTKISIPSRPLGKDGRHVIPPAPKAVPPSNDNNTVTLTRDELHIMIQNAVAAAVQQKQEPAPRLVERPRSEINQLRDECKALGIKMERKDNIETLTAKIAAKRQESVS
jgi:hypothetical protein